MQGCQMGQGGELRWGKDIVDAGLPPDGTSRCGTRGRGKIKWMHGGQEGEVEEPQ